MNKTLTIAATLAALSLTAIPTASTTQAQTAYKCHGDPVCQAKRDGVSVQQAKQKHAAIATCARRAGISANAWSAGTVPAGPGVDKMRACMAGAQ